MSLCLASKLVDLCHELSCLLKINQIWR
jgi:hypothetical protein